MNAKLNVAAIVVGAFYMIWRHRVAFFKALFLPSLFTVGLIAQTALWCIGFAVGVVLVSLSYQALFDSNADAGGAA